PAAGQVVGGTVMADREVSPVDRRQRFGRQRGDRRQQQCPRKQGGSVHGPGFPGWTRQPVPGQPCGPPCPGRIVYERRLNRACAQADTSTRLRPLRLARYRASSAAASRRSGALSTSPGRMVKPATPTLTVTVMLAWPTLMAPAASTAARRRSPSWAAAPTSVRTSTIQLGDSNPTWPVVVA